MGLDAPDILANMAAVYGACRSYRDSGSASRISTSDGRTRTQRLPFSTAFVRPDGFRFEFRRRTGYEEDDQTAVWLVDGQASTWWSARQDERKRNRLGMALAGATGVSGGSAHTVPRLLLPEEVGGWCVTDQRDIQMGAETDVDGHRCLAVTGKHPRGFSIVLYIDAVNLLIRRIDHEEHAIRPLDIERDIPESVKAGMSPDVLKRLIDTSKRPAGDAFMSKEITLYSPEINIAIAPEELIFSPPA